jgi:hypothetical protein
MGNPVEFEASRREFMLLLDCLVGDVRAIEVGSKPPWPQPLRRSYCRAVFALIDGATFGLKQHVLEMFEYELGEEEIARLREWQESKGKSSPSSGRPLFLPVAKNVFFAFDMLSNCCGAQNPIDRSGGEWRTFLEAISIRNRITHPKNAAALEVTDGQLAKVAAASRWYVETLYVLHTESARSLLDRVRVLDSIRAEMEFRGVSK